jgi:thioredoxin 1
MTREITELTTDTFDDFIKDDKAVVDFWAPWCGPCKMMIPIFEGAAKELKDKAKFGKVNVDEEGELAQRFQVMSIPTMLFFRDGRQEDRAVGVLPKDEIVKKIKGMK